MSEGRDNPIIIFLFQVSMRPSPSNLRDIVIFLFRPETPIKIEGEDPKEEEVFETPLFLISLSSPFLDHRSGINEEKVCQLAIRRAFTSLFLDEQPLFLTEKWRGRGEFREERERGRGGGR